MSKVIKSKINEENVKQDEVVLEDFPDLDMTSETNEFEANDVNVDEVRTDDVGISNADTNEINTDNNVKEFDEEEQKLIDDIMNLTNSDSTDVIISEKKKYVKGRVTGCGALRVRGNPNSKGHEIGRLERDEIVRISISESTEKFYAVVTEKYEGFCMKDFIMLI